MTACSMPFLTPKGSPVSRNYELSGFTGISASCGFETKISQGDDYKVTITTNEHMFDYINVYVSGTTLILEPKPLSFQSFSVLKAEITMPELEKINLSAGATGTVKGFVSTKDLAVSLSSGSELDMDIQAGNTEIELSSGSEAKGNLKASDTTIRLSSGSHIEINGTVNNLLVNASSGAQTKLAGLISNNADVRLSGGGQATVKTIGTLDANLSSGAQLRYTGNPKIGSIKVSGGATINQV